MRSTLRCAALALIGLAGSCANDTNLKVSGPSEPAQTEAMISAAELSRAPSAEVRALLHSGSAELRAREALALGRIGDVDAVSPLAELLSHEGPDGAAAAWALGRLHPSTPIGGIQTIPAASDPAASNAPAIAPADAESFLRACLQSHCAQEVEAARALGAAPRRDETLAQLASALEGRAPVATQAALALGILVRLSGKGADEKIAAVARTQLWRALARPESAVRYGAAYALGRLPREGAPGAGKSAAQAAKGDEKSDAKSALPELTEARKAALDAALRDPDAETRSAAARAAGKQGLRANELLGAFVDPDWRVRVEAARAFAQAPGGNALLGPAIRAQAGQLASAKDVESAKWAHPLIELLGSAQALKLAREDFPTLESLSGPTAASTAAIRCADADARDRRAGALLETPTCAAGLEEPWRSRFRTAALAAELAGDNPENPAGRALIAALSDTDPRVRSAAAQSASPAFALQLLACLDDPDPYVVASTAGALAKDRAVARSALPAATRAAQRFFGSRAQPTGDARADALSALADLVTAALAPPELTPNSSAAIAPMPALSSSPSPDLLLLRPLFSLDTAVSSIGLFHALAELQPLLFSSVNSPLDASRALDATRPVAASPLPLPPAPLVPAASELGLPGHGPRLRTLLLTTTAGDLRARLFAEDGATPLTAAALATLANRGFYDGLSFHRVVPDFVAQGGDPLGDGEGGSGWALPDEHTPIPFLRGSLGIATSGPETGGSQIFFCHASVPHLDGRYTVAGQLESGEAAMDALQVGDRILRARAE